MVLSDNGTPKLSSTTRVVITVADVNDNGPEFQQKFYKAQIPATAKMDDKLYQVTDFTTFFPPSFIFVLVLFTTIFTDSATEPTP